LLYSDFPDISCESSQLPINVLVLFAYVVHLGGERLADAVECDLEGLHIRYKSHNDLVLILAPRS